MENMEDSVVKHVLHISMRESHNTSISDSFHSIIAVRNVSEIFVSRTEAPLRTNHKLSSYMVVKKDRGLKGFKGSTRIQAP